MIGSRFSLFVLVAALAAVVNFTGSVAEASDWPASHEAARDARKSAWKSAMWNMKPSTKMTQGKCDINIDCPNYRITVNGKNVGQINCGRQTAQKFRTGTLDTKMTYAAGKIMPKGYPMLATKPMLCGNCYIHAYTRVGPGSRSMGCVGVQKQGWEALAKCGGSSFTITPVGEKKKKESATSSKSGGDQ